MSSNNEAKKPGPKWVVRGGWALASVVSVLIVEYVGFNYLLKLEEHNIALMSKLAYPLLTHVLFQATPLHTTIVRVDAPHSQNGPEEIRPALAELLPKIASLHPDAIVVDVTLRNNRRPGAVSFDRVTTNLLAVVHQVCDETTIVFGARYSSETHRVDDHISLVPQGKPSKCVEGVMNAENSHGDYRVLPLRFGAARFPSLSYAAARSFRPQLADDPDIREHWASGEPMYAALLTTKDYNSRLVTDDEVLSAPVKAEVKEKIEHHVVVIGFKSEPLVDGIPGYMVHAAYIEAFISRKFLHEFGYLNWVVGTLFWFAVYWQENFRRQLACIMGILAALWIVELFLMALFRVYSDFALISLPGVIVWIIYQLKTSFHAAGHARAPS